MMPRSDIIDWAWRGALAAAALFFGYQFVMAVLEGAGAMRLVLPSALAFGACVAALISSLWNAFFAKETKAIRGDDGESGQT